MKLQSVYFFLCVVIFSTSCFNHKQETTDEQSKTTQDIPQTEENFDTFLINFSNKPTFQRKRVIFPIQAVLLKPSEYGMEIVDEMITYQDWVLLDFTYDSTYTMRKVDSYEQHIRVYEDSSIIEHRGIDNDIYGNYYFIKKDGKWFLKSFSDVF